MSRPLVVDCGLWLVLLDTEGARTADRPGDLRSGAMRQLPCTS